MSRGLPGRAVVLTAASTLHDEPDRREPFQRQAFAPLTQGFTYDLLRVALDQAHDWRGITGDIPLALVGDQVDGAVVLKRRLRDLEESRLRKASDGAIRNPVEELFFQHDFNLPRVVEVV